MAAPHHIPQVQSLSTTKSLEVLHALYSSGAPRGQTPLTSSTAFLANPPGSTAQPAKVAAASSEPAATDDQVARQKVLAVLLSQTHAHVNAQGATQAAGGPPPPPPRLPTPPVGQALPVTLPLRVAGAAAGTPSPPPTTDATEEGGRAPAPRVELSKQPIVVCNAGDVQG